MKKSQKKRTINVNSCKELRIVSLNEWRQQKDQEEEERVEVIEFEFAEEVIMYETLQMIRLQQEMMEELVTLVLESRAEDENVRSLAKRFQDMSREIKGNVDELSLLIEEGCE
ncbi:hypothetical protein ACFYKX_11750 [Cytobacillus sp. FJAT-54145]|uniref:Uncharacterized protein n=1 Tax=Cytobacillus spartinae TaxID=3299023 RepID=A0ABW6K9U2_9BACI